MLNLYNFISKTKSSLFIQLRWSYLPPLMIYMAAGISGLTGIVGIFFLKDYLDLSAAFIASLGFWAGIPWALKMPLGHIVDLIWKRKSYLVFLGCLLISISLLIMHLIIVNTKFMSTFLEVQTWFVISTLLAPIGYVLQDVVADAMTVEAIPVLNNKGYKYNKQQTKEMHTTMQTLGRFAIISGTLLVALINVILFSNANNLEEEEKILLYGDVYLYALIIPLISVSGVFLASYLRFVNKRKLKTINLSNSVMAPKAIKIKPNYFILLGSLVFVLFTLVVGGMKLQYAQEIVFIGSMLIIFLLMKKLVYELPENTRNMVIGTAIIIFIFRAIPYPGPGLNWFEIDELNFNEQFFSLLSLISSVLTLIGIVIFRPLMSNNSIAKLIIILSVVSSVLMLPSIGMFYGIHNVTASLTNGFVDAKFIAIINTALESPLGQVAMIPLLAWIAKNAPNKLKATFFAVFASFTNLALSARDLGTKYLNQIFIIEREVKDISDNEIITSANYNDLGPLLITVLLLSLALPILSILIIQKTKFQTNE